MSLVRPSLEFAAAVWVPTDAGAIEENGQCAQWCSLPARKSLGLPPWTSTAAVMEEIGVWPQWARQDFLVLLSVFWLPVRLPCQSSVTLVLSSSLQVGRQVWVSTEASAELRSANESYAQA